MLIIRFLLLVLLTCLLASCQSETPKETLQVTPPSKLDLLVFQSERELELWAKDSLRNRKTAQFTLEEMPDIPIGIFEVNIENDSILINDKKNLALRNSIPSKYADRVKNCPDILSLLSVEDAVLLRKLLPSAVPKRLLIFPHRLNKDQQFSGKPNSAVNTTELYSTMALWLSDYELAQ